LPTAICVDSTEQGIPEQSTVAGVNADGSPDGVDSNGEDSEMDESLEIFDLERLDFDDEKGVQEM
jgi:hypothetical protein